MKRRKIWKLGERHLDRWIAKQGPGSKVLLHRASGCAHATIRKALDGFAIREDSAIKISRIVGGSPAELTREIIE